MKEPSLSTNVKVSLKTLESNKMLVEMFASSTDAFLQEFDQAVKDGDVKRILIASARLAELGNTMKAFFKGAAGYLCEDEGDVKLANEIVKQTSDMLEKRLESVNRVLDDEPEETGLPKLAAKPNGALN